MVDTVEIMKRGSELKTERELSQEVFDKYFTHKGTILVICPYFDSKNLVVFIPLVVSRCLGADFLMKTGNPKFDEVINRAVTFSNRMGMNAPKILDCDDPGGLLDSISRNNSVRFLNPLPTNPNVDKPLTDILPSGTRYANTFGQYPIFHQAEERGSFVEVNEVLQDENSGVLRETLNELTALGIAPNKIKKISETLKTFISKDTLAGSRNPAETPNIKTLIGQIQGFFEDFGPQFADESRLDDKKHNPNYPILKLDCTASGMGVFTFTNQSLWELLYNPFTAIPRTDAEVERRLKEKIGNDFKGGVFSPMLDVTNEISITALSNTPEQMRATGKVATQAFWTNNITNVAGHHQGNLVFINDHSTYSLQAECLAVVEIIWKKLNNPKLSVAEIIADTTHTISGDFGILEGVLTLFDPNFGRNAAPVNGALCMKALQELFPGIRMFEQKNIEQELSKAETTIIEQHGLDMFYEVFTNILKLKQLLEFALPFFPVLMQNNSFFIAPIIIPGKTPEEVAKNAQTSTELILLALSETFEKLKQLT